MSTFAPKKVEFTSWKEVEEERKRILIDQGISLSILGGHRGKAPDTLKYERVVLQCPRSGKF